MITLDKVTKQYDNGVTGIRDVNIDIKQGEFVYIVGPSGAGKSTFIKMLYHELTPTSGDIKFNDFDFATMKRRDLPMLRREMGIVFQDFKLLPRLTVFENIAYAMQVVETPDAEIKPRVLEVLKEVGLEHKLRRFPDELSGGEQQRVSIARAIVNKPSVLIADEPTGNLDPETSDGIMDIIETINGQNTTIIMATHNRDVVNSRPHRVLEIAGGEIIRDEEKGNYGLED
ncbi:cell division ATP-binding protein FtsE [Lacticaseibacillus pabuli]|uniref:Cell division ATP-binding protein FtsE n=1 Tax=Lacticaseibacillus pabuli TaxID=3025672 RepID=A0ABY7WP73_9LACO|nr:cell division ATP-binding protein FtsE [Lacticaseibacillus sp. KACC 23028]WDF81992.1 cell division ATP-binding protein FtsE [Lacticaseibacillus sp. KACC 23028]